MRQNVRARAALSALLWIIVPAVVFLSPTPAFLSPTPAVLQAADAQDAKTIVENSLRAMGAANLNAIVYSGEGAYGNFGQSRTISFGLSSISIRNYTRAIDFTRPAMRETGTAVPIAGPRTPQPTGPDAAPRPFELTAPVGEGWPAQMEIWVTPWGFLKGALANSPVVRSRKIDGVTYQVVTWNPPQKAPSGQPYRVVGYINPQQIVERVETWIEHPVLGDLHVETFFNDYADFGGGLLAPVRITQRRVGLETYVALLREVRANPANLVSLMTPTTTAPAAAPAVLEPAASEKLADGVYRITGGYVSLAVEFRDHVVVLEGAQSEARGRAVIAEVKKLFPGKRIKYIVNTHPHFDHASGLAPFCAEGAIVLTDDNSKYFVEQALLSPRTLVGDTLAKSRKKPKVEGVVEKHVLQDDTRTVELHHVAGLEHSDAMLLAYLPKEKILFTADFNPPPAGQPVSPSIATLVANIERLQLDFDRHVMVHAPSPDRPMTKADLLALVKETK
jgi:glyoxylase-like metal-dependent hydrolase (beta-lactamase superfamily II)